MKRGAWSKRRPDRFHGRHCSTDRLRIRPNPIPAQATVETCQVLRLAVYFHNRGRNVTQT